MKLRPVKTTFSSKIIPFESNARLKRRSRLRVDTGPQAAIFLALFPSYGQYPFRS
jgi:hypothetical protein